MLFSLALILLFGGLAGRLAQKFHLPSLLGMLFAGILLGPSMLNAIDPLTLDISPVLRQIALIIILTRAGLSLSLADLRKIGRPAVAMSFVPALCEMFGVMLFAPLLLGVRLLDAALMGSVLAAVSPAVVIPHMLHVQDEGYGNRKGIPQLILAGASVDDVIVIVIFTVLLSLTQSATFSWLSFALIPVQIVSGMAVGLGVGWIFAQFIRRFEISAVERTIYLLALTFLLVTVENETNLPFSGLLAVMFAGIMIQREDDRVAQGLEHHYRYFWSVASIALFVLVGVSVHLSYLFEAGLTAVVVIFGALIFRMFGVWLSLLGTDFNFRERLFTMLAYTPKATVQASIGGIPLAIGLASGHIILVVSVVSIMITAPLGAFLIEQTYEKLLEKD